MSINSPDVSYAMAAFLVKIHCLNYPLGIAYSKQPAQIFTGLQHLVMQGSRLSFISKELLRPREPKMLAQSHPVWWQDGQTPAMQDSKHELDYKVRDVPRYH